MEQVSKGMMEELEGDCSVNDILDYVYGIDTVEGYPFVHSYLMTHEFSNDAYFKIIKHISGDPQFEAEKPKKYIVQYKETDEDGDYWFLTLCKDLGFEMVESRIVRDFATRFDTREEAEQYSNPLTEVVEVEE